MADPPTPLALPSDLPYPVTLTRLLVSAGDAATRGTRLLEYSFLSATARRERARPGGARPNEGDDMVGSWECPVEGTIDGWEAGVVPGRIIEQSHASRPIVRIVQPCTHPVQLHGMCGICGADLTEDDYLSRPSTNSNAGPSRHPGSYELAHDAMGVTVSTNARRLETLARDTLLGARKLSLIVDLDQTIIHTTVDPTVGEWMAEMDDDAADAAQPDLAVDSGSGTRNAGDDDPAGEDGAAASDPPGNVACGDASSAVAAARSTTLPLAPRRKERNPNAEALKDVARFQLADDLPPGVRRGAEPVRWYYTKPRFLARMSALYEMHVYTMGTRTYADAICRVIDPDGTIFAGRILSRDESGSMSQKSLVRLFPTDHSMVVVIDDRSDVWGDCPNLVKVIPYDFFIGIGDINGTFLPPTKSALNPSTSAASASTSSAASAVSLPSTPLSSDASASPPVSPLPATPDDVDGGIEITDEDLLRRQEVLDAVSESRPLAKAQDALEREAEAAAPGLAGEGPEVDVAEGQVANATSAATDAAPGAEHGDSAQGSNEVARPRKPLLNPNDYELDRVAAILRTVHDDYYRAYDARGRRDADAPLPLGCDVELIIPTLKAKVLDGCVILFSAVIARGQRAEESETWQAAESFGARCVHYLSTSVTHVVTNALGTEKAVQAARMGGGVRVVWLEWLVRSMASWRREAEDAWDASPSGEMRARWGQPVVGANGAGAQTSTTAGAGAPPDTDQDGRAAEPMAVDAAASDERAPPGTDDDGAVGVGNGDGVDTDGEGDALGSDWGHAWDADDDRELEEFMAGGSDYEGEGSEWGGGGNGGNDSEAELGGGGSEAGSVPSTPRKRVRYADEEALPLESFKDPSPDSQLVAAKKRPRALLPPPEGDEVPEANRFTFKRRKGDGDNDAAGHAAAGDAADTPIEGDGAAGEDEDEFAKMSLA